MAVSSGLSVSSDRPASFAARSPWALSWPLALGLLIFICLTNVEGLPLLADPDTHWHIAVGTWILEHGAVPDVDIYSFTFAGQPWIAKEWLSQVLAGSTLVRAAWSCRAAAFGVTSALPADTGSAALAGAAVHRRRVRDDAWRDVRLAFPLHAVVGVGADPRGRGGAPGDPAAAMLAGQPAATSPWACC